MSEDTTTTTTDEGATPAPQGGAAPPPEGASAGAAPAPDDTSPKGGTLLTGNGEGDGKPVQSKWPENWRADMASGDEKLAKTLERYATPADAAKALREAQRAISEGQGKRQALPTDATPEQIAAYREANGIPEKADGYLETLPDGLVIGKQDEDLAKDFLAKMHEANAPAEYVHNALAWYNQLQEQQVQQQQNDDVEFHNSSINELREEWGPEYQMNVNSISNLINSVAEPLPDGTDFAEWLQSARTPDGQLLGDHPAFLKTLLSVAKQVNPAGVTMPGEGMGQIDSVNGEIEQIEKLMNQGSKEYWNDPKKQERYRQLLEARAKLAP
jgi:hypothetical protein